MIPARVERWQRRPRLPGDAPGGNRPHYRASLLAGLAVALLAAGCAADRLPTSPPIETADDFIAALRHAGAKVDETAILPFAPGLVGGRVIFVGDERMEVFESASQAQRQVDLEGHLDHDWEGRPAALWAAGRIIVLYHGTDGPTIALVSGLMGEVVGLPGATTVEPYPPAVAAAIAWLAQERGADPGSIEVLGYEPAEWPDACLGVARPQEVCAMVLTLGWKVRLNLNGVGYVLRTDSLGLEIRGENP